MIFPLSDLLSLYYSLFVGGEIMPHILTSCRRVIVGLVLASAIGVPWGY